jgi:hypothetical protein
MKELIEELNNIIEEYRIHQDQNKFTAELGNITRRAVILRDGARYNLTRKEPYEEDYLCVEYGTVEEIIEYFEDRHGRKFTAKEIEDAADNWYELVYDYEIERSN